MKCPIKDSWSYNSVTNSYHGAWFYWLFCQKVTQYKNYEVSDKKLCLPYWRMNTESGSNELRHCLMTHTRRYLQEVDVLTV